MDMFILITDLNQKHIVVVDESPPIEKVINSPSVMMSVLVFKFEFKKENIDFYNEIFLISF